MKTYIFVGIIFALVHGIEAGGHHGSFRSGVGVGIIAGVFWPLLIAVETMPEPPHD